MANELSDIVLITILTSRVICPIGGGVFRISGVIGHVVVGAIRFSCLIGHVGGGDICITRVIGQVGGDEVKDMKGSLVARAGVRSFDLHRHLTNNPHNFTWKWKQIKNTTRACVMG